MYNVRVQLEEGVENGSKFRIYACKLEGEGGEDETEVAAVFKIARTNEGRSQLPVGKDSLAGYLGNCGLSGASEPVQPEDRRLAEVPGPRLDIVQDGLPRALEAPFAISVSIFGSAGTVTAVQLDETAARQALCPPT